MEFLPAAPQYRGLQADIIHYINGGGKDINPAVLVDLYPPDRHYDADNFGLMGAYAHSVILRSPRAFAHHAISDILLTGQIAPNFYSPYRVYAIPNRHSYLPAKVQATVYETYPYGYLTLRSEPDWFGGLFVISSIEQSAYVLLPLLLLGVAFWLWRRPRDTEGFLVLVMLVSLSLLRAPSSSRRPPISRSSIGRAIQWTGR
jgi:hypothetical protein